MTFQNNTENDQSINARIKGIKIYYFGNERGSHKLFCDKVGVKSNTASNWMKDGYSVGMDVVSQILKAFPEVRSNWLITGEGEMLNNAPRIELQQIPTEENTGEFFTENSNGAKFYDLGNGKYRMLTKLVPFCAYGKFANEADRLDPDKEDWEEESFEVSNIVHGNYLSFEIKGESMDDGTRNSFEAGDRVLVRELDRIHWKDTIRYNEYPYWVVVFDSSVLIKQMINQDLERGIITFHSLNASPEYCDFQLSLNEIRKLYYVVQKKPKTVNY